MSPSLKRGSCILSESPFVHVLKSKFRGERCDHCLQLNKVRKCSSCKYVAYCNQDCQSSAWEVHKTECAYLKKVYPKIVPDAARVLLRIVLKLRNGGDRIRGYYTEKCYRKYMDLMSHYNEIKCDPKRLEHLESLRAVLTDLLGNLLVPNEAELLSMYGRLITNGFNILDPEMNAIGTGIYLGVSVVDHSCKPNAVATFEGTTLSIRLIEDIPSLDWSKIFISYIDLLSTSTERRNDLKANYYFLCCCSQCVDKQKDMEMNAASCVNERCDALVDIESDRCEKCNSYITMEHREKFKEIMDLTKNHLQNMEDIAYLDVCEICLNKQESLLHPLNVWHVKTLDAAFEAAIKVQKWTTALEYGLRLIPGFRKYCGDWNPLLGLLYLKCGKLLLYENRLQEAFENLIEAEKIIAVTHGKNHSLYNEQLVPLLMQAREG